MYKLTVTYTNDTYDEFTCTTINREENCLLLLTHDEVHTILPYNAIQKIEIANG